MDLTLVTSAFTVIRLPQPEDLVEKGLVEIFGPGLVATGYVLAVSVTSWIGFLRSSGRRGAAALRFAGASFRTFAESSRQENVMRGAYTIGVLAFQLGWVLLGFYVGNIVSFAIHQGSSQFPSASVLLTRFTWDDYSRASVGIGLAVLILNYVTEQLGRMIARGVAIALQIYAILAGIGFLINFVLLLLGSPPQGMDRNAVAVMLLLTLISGAYALTTHGLGASVVGLKTAWVQTHGSDSIRLP